MRELIIRILQFLPEKLFIYLVFMLKLRYLPNLSSPKSFNEKCSLIEILWTGTKLNILIMKQVW